MKCSTPCSLQASRRTFVSPDIYILIKERSENRRSYTGPGSQVDDKIDLVFLENLFEMLRFRISPVTSSNKSGNFFAITSIFLILILGS